MSRIRETLKSIVLDENSSFSGQIQSITGSTAIVLTKDGPTRVATQGVQFASGTEVRVQNGVIVGKVKRTDALPVYRV